VSSMLDLKHSISYEGQAAIALETIVDRGCRDAYQFDLGIEGYGVRVIRADPVVRRAIEDLLAGESPGVIAARFHLAVANLIALIGIDIRTKYGLNRVALSGGVFQNVFLLERTAGLLEAGGFEVLTHCRVPPNDGGISLGQAAIANARLQSGGIH